MPMTVEVDQFRSLEEGLWRQETRSDQGFLDGLLTESFTDFCRFGHVYDRNDLIDAPAANVEVEFPFEDFKVERLAPTVALVTYVNTVISDGTRQRARRSSIWVDESGTWRLTFVQATTLD
jgi:glyoxylase I family protein